MLKLWKGFKMAIVVHQVAGTLQENLDWRFWCCGWITEWCFLLPRASLFGAALLPLSCSNIGKTCQRGFELACLASVGHTSTSHSWSTAQSCAKLQMSLEQTALRSQASGDSPCSLGFPVRFSADGRTFFPCSMRCCGAHFHPECCLFWQRCFSKGRRGKRLGSITGG